MSCISLKCWTPFIKVEISLVSVLDWALLTFCASCFLPRNLWHETHAAAAMLLLVFIAWLISRNPRLVVAGSTRQRQYLYLALMWRGGAIARTSQCCGPVRPRRPRGAAETEHRIDARSSRCRRSAERDYIIRTRWGPSATCATTVDWIGQQRQTDGYSGASRPGGWQWIQ